MTENTTGDVPYLTAKLNELSEKLKGLELEAAELKKQIIEKKLAVVKIQHGVFIGCIVKNKKGELFKVCAIDTRYERIIYLDGHKQKKDGGFAINSQFIHEWELVP